MQLSTIAQKAAKDWRFFTRLDDPEASFTARKYDEVVAWFAQKWMHDKAVWPDSVPWPEGVPRPTSGVPA